MVLHGDRTASYTDSEPNRVISQSCLEHQLPAWIEAAFGEDRYAFPLCRWLYLTSAQKSPLAPVFAAY